MNWENIYKIIQSDYLKLLPIMGLAFYIAFIPHQSYPYPVHIDEWFHWAFADEIINKAGISGLNNPFLGGATVWNQQFELGFHVFFAVFKLISGIAWLDIVRYFPSIIFMMTVLSSYVLGRRQGFGWEAAFFTCMVTTTVGILGPAFLVPVAMGLLFIPLSIFIAYNFSTFWSYVVLFIFTVFLASMHAATAVGIIIILTPFILLNIKGNFKHSLGITIALIVPFLATFPWVFDMLLRQISLLFVQRPVTWYVDIPRMIHSYGYLPITFCLLGTFLLALRGGKRNYGLVLGLLALVATIAIYYTLHYGVPSLYERGLVYAMLAIGIVGGAGLMGLHNLRLPPSLSAKPKVNLVTKILGITSCVIFIVMILVISIPQRQNTPYYHMINNEEYQAFTWIRDNIEKEHDKAILDPWKATPFTAITEKKAYSRTHTFPTSKDKEALDFLNEGCTDTAFLKENGISIIYTLKEVNNPDLVEVRENVYLLKEFEKEQ